MFPVRGARASLNPQHRSLLERAAGAPREVRAGTPPVLDANNSKLLPARFVASDKAVKRLFIIVCSVANSSDTAIRTGSVLRKRTRTSLLRSTRATSVAPVRYARRFLHRPGSQPSVACRISRSTVPSTRSLTRYFTMSVPTSQAHDVDNSPRQRALLSATSVAPVRYARRFLHRPGSQPSVACRISRSTVPSTRSLTRYFTMSVPTSQAHDVDNSPRQRALLKRLNCMLVKSMEELQPRMAAMFGEDQAAQFFPESPFVAKKNGSAAAVPDSGDGAVDY